MKTLLIALLLMSSSAMSQNYYLNQDRYAPVRTDRSNPVGREISEGRDYQQVMKQQNARDYKINDAIMMRELTNGNGTGIHSNARDRY